MNEIDNLIKNKINSEYGFLITINNKKIYEKYTGDNNVNTRFRIFSCSKPICSLAIMYLAQKNKLKLSDTIDKYGINIKYNNLITITHLIYHASGIYDAEMNIYRKLKPKQIFQSILDLEKKETKFVNFRTMIKIINDNEPVFKPKEDLSKAEYNNTGYDLLGYIIYKVTNMHPGVFIKKIIFDKLKMNDTGFQYEKNKNESIPYDINHNIGIKTVQNWFSTNAFVVSSIRDLEKFLNSYDKILNKEYLDIYRRIPYFKNFIINNKNYTIFSHAGEGDISIDFANSINTNEKIPFHPLSRTYLMNICNNDTKINIILSETFRNTNGFFNKKKENWNTLMEIIDKNFL